MNTSAAPHFLRASEDYHLLVTHTTILDPTAIAHLLSCAVRVARHDPTPTIIVGATRCPTSGNLSTSALNRTAPRSRSYTRVTPTLACMPVDTFDPNCLLVPNDLLPIFEKQSLTSSLGLRLRRQGINIFLAPGTVGTCPPPAREPARRSSRKPGTALSRR